MFKYQLLDAEEQHRRHPRSFHLPPLNARQTVPTGAYAKLVFPGNPGERLWVYVGGRTPEGGYVGELVDAPLYLKTIKWGDEVRFEPRHIIEIDRTPMPPLEFA